MRDPALRRPDRGRRGARARRIAAEIPDDLHHDRIGPLGARSMRESPFNPAAAALGNALRDALGVRLHATPFRADRIRRIAMAAPSPAERRGPGG